MRALHRHDWPGNIRKLQQTLSAAVIFANAGPVRAWQLDSQLMRMASAEAIGSEPVSERQRIALELVADEGAVRRLDLVRRLGVSRETARRELRRLVGAGLLRRVGAGRWVRYVRSDPRSAR